MGVHGFYFINCRRLYEYHLESPDGPRRHLHSCQSIIDIQKGPDGSVLLLEDRSLGGGDIGKLYFPESGELVRLEPALFGGEVWDWLKWSEEAECLYAINAESLAKVPLKILRKQERISV